MKRYKLIMTSGKGYGWLTWNAYETKERAEQAISDIRNHYQWRDRLFKIVDRLDNSTSIY